MQKHNSGDAISRVERHDPIISLNPTVYAGTIEPMIFNSWEHPFFLII
jgi:hypothetical protein